MNNPTPNSFSRTANRGKKRNRDDDDESVVEVTSYNKRKKVIIDIIDSSSSDEEEECYEDERKPAAAQPRGDAALNLGDDSADWRKREEEENGETLRAQTAPFTAAAAAAFNDENSGERSSHLKDHRAALVTPIDNQSTVRRPNIKPEKRKPSVVPPPIAAAAAATHEEPAEYSVSPRKQDVISINDSSDEEDDRKPAAQPRGNFPSKATNNTAVDTRERVEHVKDGRGFRQSKVAVPFAAAAAAATCSRNSGETRKDIGTALATPTDRQSTMLPVKPSSVSEEITERQEADKPVTAATAAHFPQQQALDEEQTQAEDFLALCPDANVGNGRLEARNPNKRDVPLFTVAQVEQLLENVQFDVNGTTSLVDVEGSKFVKGSKVSKEDTTEQERALYGRALPALVEYLDTARVFTTLDDTDHFLDIGHGVGTVCIQVALTKGCAVKGIELQSSRNHVANGILDDIKGQISVQDDYKKRRHGEVRLRHGRLEDPAHRCFLTESVNRALCNNFNAVLGGRANDSADGRGTPDYHLAGLFTQMLPEAELVTLHPLPALPPTCTQVNDARKASGLQEVEDASFYDIKEFVVEGKAGGAEYLDFLNPIKSFTLYRYTKLCGNAEFVCSNKLCRAAQNKTRIQAWEEVETTMKTKTEGVTHSRPELRIVPVSECPHCNSTHRSTRRRQERVKYSE